MPNQVFSDLEFRRLLLNEDFKSFGISSKSSGSITEQIINLAKSASKISRDAQFDRSAFAISELRGRKVYRVVDPASRLVLRKISRNLAKAYKVKNLSRNQIILLLSTLLGESVQFRIYRFDIREFYESVDARTVIEKMHQEQALSQKTIKLLRNLLATLSAPTSLRSFPRGLSVSGIFSDISMNSADRLCRRHEEVYFYARFVDDIIILTTGAESVSEFERSFVSSLPGCQLNEKKRYVCTLRSVDEDLSSYSDAVFEYLGYQFIVSQRISNRNSERPVRILISKKKIKKIKTRILRSFVSYKKDRDFDLLRDRLRVLTSNYEFYDARKERKIYSGIYFSYKFITDTSDLLALDRFLYWAVSIKMKNACSFTSKECRSLKSFSFLRGFEQKKIYYFTGHRLAQIQKCWMYE